MEFIAAVQIVVYAGGIVVIIIFSIFLTEHSGKEMRRPVKSRKVFSSLAVLSGFALTYLLINQNTFKANSTVGGEVSVANIGSQMLSTTEHGYILPFEVVSMLLLAAMIGCIVIASSSNSLKGGHDNKKNVRKNLQKDNMPGQAFAVKEPLEFNESVSGNSGETL